MNVSEFGGKSVASAWPWRRYPEPKAVAWWITSELWTAADLVVNRGRFAVRHGLSDCLRASRNSWVRERYYESE